MRYSACPLSACPAASTRCASSAPLASRPSTLIPAFHAGGRPRGSSFVSAPCPSMTAPTDSPSTIRLTGASRRRQHIVLIDGQRVFLSSSLLEALCRLGLRRLTSTQGYACESALTVLRLRRRFEAVIGPQAARNLIETCPGGYRINARIVVDPDLFELPVHILGEALAR